MPGTVNGFGTAYWGKRNHRVHRDFCQACGKLGDLSDYDTRAYFVALYLPLIPLGRKRIFDDCPACRRHRMLKLKEWHATRDHELESAQVLFKQEPGKAEAALSLIGKTLTFGQEQDFLGATRGVMERHGSNAEALSLVGYGLDRWGHRAEAEKVLRRSLELGEAPGARKHLAWLLLHSGRIDEARSLLAGAYQTRDSSLLPSLYFLVEVLQSEGDHAEALRQLEAIEETWPGESQDPSLVRYRKASEKHFRSGKKLVSAALKPTAVATPGGRDWGGLFASFLSPALLALILVPALGGIVRAATSHPVHFISGLERPYRVQIGDKALPLAAGGSARHRIPLGKDVQITASGKGFQIEPSTVRAEVSIWKSLFGHQVLIVNPDRSALLVQDRQMYIEEGADESKFEDEGPPMILRAGLSFYQFEDIDYVFRDYPDQVEMPGSSKVIWKRGLRRLEIPVASGWSWMMSQGREDEAEAWLVARLRQGLSDDEVEPALLGQSMDSGRFAEAAATKLEEGPLNIPWHRVYQGLLEREGRDEEAREMYRIRLQEDPENGDCLYLLSRVVIDPGERSTLLSAAVEAKEPKAWPLYGAGFQELTEGRFEAAIGYFERALEVEPDRFLFTQMETDALKGLQRYEELALRSIEQRGGEANYQAMAQEVLWLTAAGEVSQADSVWQAAKAALEEEGVSAEYLHEWQSWFEAWKLLGKRDLEGYLVALEKGEEKAVLQEALFQVNGAAFAEAREEIGGLSVGQMLLAHLVFLEADPDQAETLLQEAVLELKSEGGDSRILAELLASAESVPNFSTVARLPIQLEVKAPALTILARRGGSAAAELQRLARKLNLGPAFEPQLLARYLG